MKLSVIKFLGVSDRRQTCDGQQDEAAPRPRQQGLPGEGCLLNVTTHIAVAMSSTETTITISSEHRDKVPTYSIVCSFEWNRFELLRKT